MASHPIDEIRKLKSQINDLQMLVDDLWQVLNDEDVKILANDHFGHEWIDTLIERSENLGAEAHDDAFYQEYFLEVTKSAKGQQEERKLILYYHLAMVETALALELQGKGNGRIDITAFRSSVATLKLRINHHLKHLCDFNEKVMEQLIKQGIARMDGITTLLGNTQEQIQFQQNILKKFYEIYKENRN